MNYIFRALLCLSLYLLPVQNIYASHVLGADLRYAWISGNTYKITMAIYGDCSATIFYTLDSSRPHIYIYDGSTYTDSLVLTVDTPSAGIEVTPGLCSGYSGCSSPSSAIPGMKLFTYSAVYTLPHNSSVWRFIFNGGMGISDAGRSNKITNIMSGSAIWLADTLNSTIGHNASPVLGIVSPYFTINHISIYSPAGVDADGDTLVYGLVAAMNASGTSPLSATAVSYIAPLSASAPIHTASGSFSLDAATGQLNFVPDLVQCADVVYNIREYRGGVLVGTMQRETTMIIADDTAHVITGVISNAPNGSITSATTIDVCDTVTDIFFEIHLSDTNFFYRSVVTAMGLPGGATFNTVNDSTHNPVSTFSWSLAGVTPGVYTFYVKFKDNACPVSGVETVAYTITIGPCWPSALPQVPEADYGQLKISPNPSNGIFTIETQEHMHNATITIIDIYGRTVQQDKIVNNTSKLPYNLNQLPEGTYMMKVVTGDKAYREKITVVK